MINFALHSNNISEKEEDFGVYSKFWKALNATLKHFGLALGPSVASEQQNLSSCVEHVVLEQILHLPRTLYELSSSRRLCLAALPNQILTLKSDEMISYSHWHP